MASFSHRPAILETSLAPTMCPTNRKQQTPAVTPRQTMRGHTQRETGAAYLLGVRQIMTRSFDGSLRLWDLESGAQIGEDWRDEEYEGEWLLSMALSPNGKTIVSGNEDGKVKLWDVETGKVVAKWTGRTDSVMSVCWSADGKRVLSGSGDGTARVWDVKTGKSILTIQTGHENVRVVTYSPDHTQIGTGGIKESIKIWDAKTGELLATLKRIDPRVAKLVWTSDGKKLISAGYGPIRIYDTTNWEQIAILSVTSQVFAVRVTAITLFQNDRLLVSVSDDKTARLWNLDTNLQVGPPIQHELYVTSTALSADGKVLVTGCYGAGSVQKCTHT